MTSRVLTESFVFRFLLEYTKPTQRSSDADPDRRIRNFCLDLDPELVFRIQQKVKEQINKL